MKKLFLLIILAASFSAVSAQEEAIFTHYHISPLLINAGAAGFNESYDLQAHARIAWTGFPDAPKNYGALFNGPLGKTFGIGLGIFSEQAAQLNRLKVQLNYAFRFNVSENFKLSAGFSTEFQQMQLNNSVMNSDFFQAGDQLLEEILDGKGVFDASIGVYGTFMENTYGGLSFNNLVRSRLDDIVSTEEKESFFSYYTFLLGHKFEVYDLGITFEPSLMVRNLRDTPQQFDINLKAGFLDEQLIAGLSYRSLGAAGLLLGTKLPSFHLYYSYDISFQRFQKFSTGTHEVTLALSFKKKDNPKGY